MRLQDVPWGPGPGVGSECTQHRAAGEEALRTEGAPSPRGTDGQGGLGGMMAPLSPSLHSTLEEDRQGGQDGESVSSARLHLESEARALLLLAKSRWWTMYPMPRLLFFSQ